MASLNTFMKEHHRKQNVIATKTYAASSLSSWESSDLVKETESQQKARANPRLLCAKDYIQRATNVGKPGFMPSVQLMAKGGGQCKLGRGVLKSADHRCELSMKSNPAAHPHPPENVFLQGPLGLS